MGRPTPRPQPAIQGPQPAGRHTDPMTYRRPERRTPMGVDAVRQRRLVTPISTKVIPEHAPPPEPPPPPAAAPPAPPQRMAKAKRRRAHGWTVMIIPPEYAGSVRSYNVRRWHLRLLTGGLVSLIVLALGGGFALGIDTSAGQMDAINTSLTETELRLSAMGDTIRALRIAATPTSAAIEPTAPSRPVVAPARGRVVAPTPAAAPAARRESAPASLVPSPGVVLPVDGRVSSGFSYNRRHPILRIRRPHLGVDIVASVGTQILAPAAGHVRYVGRKLAYGVVVEIDHGGGVVTRYAHCRTSLVKVGQEVTPGMPIATVGSSGLSTGPHVHYEVLINNRQVNPLRYPLGSAVQSATTTTPAPDSGAATTPPASVTPPTAPGPIPQSTPDTSAGKEPK